MSAREPAHARRLGGGGALLGLLLIGASLIWLERIPVRERLLPNQRPVPAGTVSLVVIDPGHGGQDSGTMRNGVMEKDLALDVAQRLERLVQARGFTSLMTRRTDEFISLGARAAVANRRRDCVFVSIHFDEGARAQATGVHTFYAARQVTRSGLPSWLPFLRPIASPLGNLESQSLAGFVQESLVSRTQAFDRGVQAEQFYVVANVSHPAVLVEGGFLSNNDDLMKLTTELYREQLAAAIADGVVRYRDVVSQPQSSLAVSMAAP